MISIKGKVGRAFAALVLMFTPAFLLADMAHASATIIVTPGGDDSSYQIPLTEPVFFFGEQYSSIYATTNAVITFGRPDGTYWDFPATPSISLGSTDWVVFPGSRSDEHFIISYTDNSFQIDMSARPIWLQNTPNPSRLILTGIINDDRTINFSYYLENTSEYELRFGVRTWTGEIKSLDDGGFTEAPAAPEEPGEIIEPTPEPTESQTISPETTESSTVSSESEVSDSPSVSEEASVSDSVSPATTESSTVSAETTESSTVSSGSDVTESSSVSPDTSESQTVSSSTESQSTESNTTESAQTESPISESPPVEPEPSPTPVPVIPEAVIPEPIAPAPVEPNPEPQPSIPEPAEPEPEVEPAPEETVVELEEGQTSEPSPSPTTDPGPAEPTPAPSETPEPIVQETKKSTPTPSPTPVETVKPSPTPMPSQTSPAPSPYPTPTETPKPIEDEKPIVIIPAELDKVVESLLSIDLSSQRIDPGQLTEIRNAVEQVFDQVEKGSSEYEEALEALAVIAEADDAELSEELAAIPVLGTVAGEVLNVFNDLGNIGADMAPEQRERAEETVIAAVIVGQVAQVAAAVSISVGRVK